VLVLALASPSQRPSYCTSSLISTKSVIVLRQVRPTGLFSSCSPSVQMSQSWRYSSTTDIKPLAPAGLPLDGSRAERHQLAREARGGILIAPTVSLVNIGMMGEFSYTFSSESPRILTVEICLLPLSRLDSQFF